MNKNIINTVKSAEVKDFSYLLSEDIEKKIAIYSNSNNNNDEIFSYLIKTEKLTTEFKDKYLRSIPIMVKDNINVKGTKSTCSSKILENYVATYDADVIRFLKEKGAIIVGKTNMDEFAMGSSTENSAFGPTRNPLNIEYIPGGSSGGSAAAVSSLMVPVALGSDTGGSVRQPASLCGIYGFKPSWGAVSRWGLVAFASSLDVIGILSSNIFDLAFIFDIISKKSVNDMTSMDLVRTEFFNELKEIYLSNDTIENRKQKIKNKISQNKFNSSNIAIIKGIEKYITCEDTKKLYFDEIERLRRDGNKIVEIDFPVPIDLPLSTYYIIAPAEASSNLARYDGIRFGKKIVDKKDLAKSDLFESLAVLRSNNFGKEVLRRITIGNFVLSSGYQDKYYSKAQNIRKYMIEKFNELFNEIDLILTPTTPSFLKKIGEKISPIDEYGADIFTVTANIIGAPAISIPVGYNSKNGVGIGMHYMAKPEKDFNLIDAIFNLYKDKILDSI